MQWLAIVLTAIFTVAKLIGVIKWSWWLVLLPAWGYLIFYVVMVVVAVIITAIKYH